MLVVTIAMPKQAGALRPTQAQRVYQAVQKGAQSPLEISKKTGIDSRVVSTILTTLRRIKSIRGHSGEMKALKAPVSKRGGRPIRRSRSTRRAK